MNFIQNAWKWEIWLWLRRPGCEGFVWNRFVGTWESLRDVQKFNGFVTETYGFLVTTVNWIMCSNKGILVNFKNHLLFLGVAGDSHTRWSHFNTIEFHPKRLKMRTLVRGKPVWLQGFCLEVTRRVPEMGSAISVYSLDLKQFPSDHCELDHL